MVRPGRIAIGVAVLAAIIGLDWWVDGVLLQSEIRDRLAQHFARPVVDRGGRLIAAEADGDAGQYLAPQPCLVRCRW